jgi:hypothetical protein
MRMAGAVLALAGAALLVISLFFDWYGYEATDVTVFGTGARDLVFTADGFSGWEAFELADVVLLLCALTTIAAVTAPRRLSSSVGLAAGVIAVLVVAVSLVNSPPILQTSEDFDLTITREVGGWLCLGGALAMLGGAVLRRESVSPASAPGTTPGPAGAGS